MNQRGVGSGTYVKRCLGVTYQREHGQSSVEATRERWLLEVMAKEARSDLEC